MEHDVRPWGEYWVLEDSISHKVKRILVNPGGRLSYQYHFKRSEVWTVVDGKAIITLDGVEKEYKIGDVAIIPQGVKHRVENRTEKPLSFIEVQYGTYFGEDDIVRIEDDYNRS